MRVIANRQLRGDYGTVAPDQKFDPGDEIANELLKSGMVRHATPPRVQYETKVIVPEAPEVSARQPFRDVPLSHAEPENVASKSNPMFPAADLPSSGAFDPRGRGGRKGSRSRR